METTLEPLMQREDESLWEELRQATCRDPDVAYLNTGSYGLPHRRVWERYLQDRQSMVREPVRFLWREFPARHWGVREALARFLNVDPYHLVFTVNVTSALNIVGQGLRTKLRAPIVVTDQEYGAMRYLWEEVARRHGVDLRVVALPQGANVTPDSIVERVEEALQPDASLLAISHVTYMTGLKLPVAQLCALARQRGVLTVVDGAHAPGMFPLDLAAIDADFYAGNCHKWLCVPISAGFLWVHPRVEGLVRPVIISWGWEYEESTRHERNEYGNTPWLRSFEFQGTRDVCSWLAVQEAVSLQNEIGRQAIWERVQQLAGRVRERLAHLDYLRPFYDGSPSVRSGVVGFRLRDDVDPTELARFLWDAYRVEAPAWELPIGKCLRISTHFYNNDEDIERLVDALQAFEKLIA